MICKMRELVVQLLIRVIIKMTKAFKGTQEEVYLIIFEYNMKL
jgi:hypothetical protein